MDKSIRNKLNHPIQLINLPFGYTKGGGALLNLSSIALIYSTIKEIHCCSLYYTVLEL